MNLSKTQRLVDQEGKYYQKLHSSGALGVVVNGEVTSLLEHEKATATFTQAKHKLSHPHFSNASVKAILAAIENVEKTPSTNLFLDWIEGKC